MQWAKEQAYLSQNKNSVPLAHSLEDVEEILIASCLALSQRLVSGGMNIYSEIEYLVVKDYCKKYGLDSIEVFMVLKEMNATIERIKND